MLHGFATDVTEQKAVEAQLELAREQALSASKAKADFLGNMSHEIRTPLNGILGLTQLVLETKLDPSQRESLDTVLKSGQTLLTLVNDVLDLSRIESGNLPLDVVPFPLDSLLTEVAAVVGPSAAEKGLELIVEVDPAVPSSVLGDPTRLRQLLTNLLGNAVKFTSEGYVGLTLTNTNHGLRFVVSDTGIGIPIEQQVSLGQPFTQLDTSTTRRYGGSGLGLALTRRMVERMSGQFSFSSQPNVGTTFTIELPLSAVGAPAPTQPLGHANVLVVSPSTPLRDATRRTLLAAGATVATLEAVDPSTPMPPGVETALIDSRSVALLVALRDANPTVRVVQLSATTQVTEPTPGILRLTRPVLPSTLIKIIHDRWTPVPAQPPPPEGTPEGLTVLLAEDNPVNAKVVTTLLRRDGHFVVLATDGKAAVAAFEAGSFDLVLMDVQMPELDGLEATRAIRNLERTQATHVPIIALTASAMTGDIGRCLEAGMDDFLSKPLNLTQLRARIRALRSSLP
jgi:CheY-like chemotaxis protein/nitrogen-specific signal transduction histidine kinase